MAAEQKSALRAVEMKTLLPKDDYGKVTAKLVGQFPDPSHATLRLDANTRVIASDGRIVAMLLCGAVPAELHKLANELLKPVDDRVDNRATAVGTLSLPKSVNPDGSVSKRSGVNARVMHVVEARQGIVGYLGRPCRMTLLTTRHPEMLDGNRRLIQLADQLYKEHLPTFYAKQWAAVEKIPHWRLGNTAFTTIYVAKNFRTAYHRDTGNMRGVMSVLMPMGRFTGGELILPRWRIAIAFMPGDLLLFDPQQLHGNLPFEGERLSAIFYCDRLIAVEAGAKDRTNRRDKYAS
jgi:hypothetical protein